MKIIHSGISDHGYAMVIYKNELYKGEVEKIFELFINDKLIPPAGYYESI
jgi:hypothetical protein